MSKLNQDQELMRNILAKEWHTLYAEEIILVMNYAKEQQAIIDDLIYKAKLRESDHQALLVKYQATKKCWEDVSGKCEELKAQLNNMEACYIEKEKELQKINISLEAGLRKNSKNKQKLLGKNIELQKRVDAALKMISINRGFSWGQVSIGQLEQALKGGDE